MSDLDTALADLTARLSEDMPEVGAILARSRAGEISELEALDALTRLVAERPALAQALQAHAMAAFAPLREDTGGVLFHSGVGLVKMNPLVEAALVERLQFDGDAPELRTGPLPEGVVPAVSVTSTARDPAVLGSLLKRASLDLEEEIRAHEKARLLSVDMALVPLADGALEAIAQGSAETDHPAYRRGEVPAPLAVEAPDATCLASMTVSQRQEAAWLLISTTVGRRTIRDGLFPMVQGLLADKGYPTNIGKGTLPLAVQEWDVNLSHLGSVQAHFAIMDVAAAALAKGLTHQLKTKGTPGNLYLAVAAINTVSDRVDGWRATVTG